MYKNELFLDSSQTEIPRHLKKTKKKQKQINRPFFADKSF